MEKKMLTLFVLLATATGFVQAQHTNNGTAEKETVLCYYAKSNVFIFSGNENGASFVTHNPMVAEHPLVAELPEQELQPVPATVAEEPVVVETLQKQPSRWYYMTGAIDDLPREELKMSYVWNSGLKIINKL